MISGLGIARVRGGPRRSGRESAGRAGRVAGVPIEISLDQGEMKKLEWKMQNMSRSLAKRAFSAASVVALKMVDKQTAANIKSLTFSDAPRKDGLRKKATIKSGYKYETKRLRSNGVMRSRSYINYRYPGLRIAHLIENGFPLRNESFYAARKFRAMAYLQTERKAQQKFIEALKVGIAIVSKSKDGRVKAGQIEKKIGKGWA